MAATVLSDILSGKVPVEEVLQWLSSNVAQPLHTFTHGHEDVTFQNLCTPGEFVSHVLNFIHEEALCFEKYRETPKKVHTPKSIRKLELSTKPKRRAALFSESPKNRMPETHQFMNSVSPISPLYTRLNTLSVENYASPNKAKNLSLADFLSPNQRRCENDALKSARRINPTNVACRQAINTENTFDFKSEQPTTNSDAKGMLKVATKVAKIVQNDIFPAFDKVGKVEKNQLITLSNLYVYLIDNNMVLNISSELYFVLTLLLSKQYATDYFTSNLFASIHNIVFFALECITRLSSSCAISVLRLLDKSTLRLLANNERVKALAPDLKLAPLADTIADSPQKTQMPQTLTVCFDSERDNREHFPSEPSFHAFRKQRDMFYEILNTWETNHSTDGWHFGAGLAAKIRHLLAMHEHPVNFRHLCRLFKSQLLATCINSDESLGNEQLSFLTNFPINTEKLNRLKSRLVVRDSATSDINSAPSFPGAQEFYKEFITYAHTHVFCAHLKDVLIGDLLALNETCFEGLFGEETRAKYTQTVRSLQILAKFLGFIESLPYKTKSLAAQNDKLMAEAVEARAWTAPSIDFGEILQKAVDKGQLIVLLPWLTEYLASLDAVTLRLPCYEAIFERLFYLFHSLKTQSQSNYCNTQLMACCLGWLFEQAHFPSELYFQFLNSLLLTNSKPRDDCLDQREMVDLHVLYAICPYLQAFKRLLQHNCNQNRSLTSKHITPVTSLESATGESERRLRLQIEESFLASKPSSLRRTLEFTSERVASSIVKTICNQVVPDCKARASREQRQLLASFTHVDLTLAAAKSEVRTKSSQLLAIHLDALRNECKARLDEQVGAKIAPAINALLCVDELTETVHVCAQITSRMCRQRVEQWMNTHINSSVFKDLNLEVDFERIAKLSHKESAKKYKNLPIQGNANIAHVDSDEDETICNPSKVMTNLQRNCAHVLSTRSEKTKMAELLQQVANCHRNRCDLSEIAWHQMNQLLVDHLLLLFTHVPSAITPEVLANCLDFWGATSPSDKELFKDIFDGVISVRNLVILKSGEEVTWKLYSQFLNGLLKNGVLSCEDFETRCLGIYKHNWDAQTLRNFAQCLQNVVQMYGNKDKFSFLLSFLSDYCTDLF